MIDFMRQSSISNEIEEDLNGNILNVELSFNNKLITILIKFVSILH